MEVWILLAAAGSGYLARRWQNAQKPKGSSADEAEDGSRAGSSQNMPSSRGRYRHFSSSARRQASKSMCGKGSSHGLRPKCTANLMDMRAGNKFMGEESGREINEVDHTCNDTKGCEICIDSRGVNLAQKRSVVQDDVKDESTHLEEGHGDSLSPERLSLNCAGNLWEETHIHGRHGLEWDTQEEDINGKGGGDFFCPSLHRSVSGKRSNNSHDVYIQQGRQFYEAGCAGKRMKDDVVDGSNKAQLSEGCVFGSWMPGFWDVSEGVFVLDTESLLVQQGETSRGSSSRKSRTPSRHGKNKDFRKKRLAGQKPMSSLESCLSAQLGDDYFRRHRKSITQPDDDLPKGSGKRFSRHSSSFVSESMLYISKTEFAIGLPSLSRMPSSKRFPSTTRAPRISIDREDANEEPFNSFASHRYESASGTKWDSKKGRSSCSMKGLLFNFGVGVGMMFTVMSNMREVRRLTLLLKEAESLIKDLEGELERKDELRSDLGSGKHDAAFEQRQSFVANSLRKVKSATQSLCNMQMILPTEAGVSSTLEHAPSKDMSKLEAELEAELARMEFSLDDVDNSNLQNALIECDGEVGNVVHGELTILGLPHELEPYSEGESSNSSHEDFHVRNYAVSPRALAKRLHEVLEARQEARICELEAELKSLSSKLQAKEEEARWLKESSRGSLATGDTERFSAVEKLQQSSPSHLQQKSSCRKEPTSLLKIARSPNPSPISPYNSSKVFNDASLFNKGIQDRSTAFITLGGEALEAYKEACDEFSKLSISGSESSLIAENRPSNRNVMETCTEEGKAEAKHLGCSDGWEQVDLLSLAQDFYGGGDHELLKSMPILNKGSIRDRRAPRRKSRVKGHPEPENFFPSSRVVDSSDDGTNDTSGSTPCSIKFMDVRTASNSQNDGTQGGEEAGEALPPSYFDWSGEILIRAGANTPNQEDYESIQTELEENSSKHVVSSKPADRKLPDDSDYYSELDEDLGRLLINRIVEKSRKGSPLVHDAQIVLALLENNEPIHSSD